MSTTAADRAALAALARATAARRDAINARRAVRQAAERGDMAATRRAATRAEAAERAAVRAALAVRYAA